MGAISKIHQWKQTKRGLVITGSIELILAYIFGSRAIDTGSYWHYLFASIFFIGFIHSIIMALKLHGEK